MSLLSDTHEQLDYLKSFAGMPAPAAFPLPPPEADAVREDKPDSITFELPTQLVQQAGRLSHTHCCGIRAVLYAAWAIVHSRYLSSEDVTFGADIEDQERLDGPFCPRPVHAVLSAHDLQASRLVRSIHEAVSSANTGLTSLDAIREAAGVSSGEPLFRLAIGFWDSRVLAQLTNELPLIVCFGKPIADAPIQVEILFAGSVFEYRAMKALAGHFSQALQGLVGEGDPRVADINILTPEESRVILHDFNDNRQEVFENDLAALDKWCMQIPFEKKVKQHSEMNAVEHYHRSITYGELNAHSNRMAHDLRQKGIKLGAPVGLLVTRSIEMIVGFWAIIKSSGAYVPIDASFPPARAQYMLQDAGCVALVTTLADDNQIRASMPSDMNIPVLKVQDFGNGPIDVENPTLINNSEDLLYVAYTSGTTGRPKGVEIPHRVMYNLILHGAGGLGNTDGTRMMQFSSIGFDNLGWEIFATHCRGGTLVVRPDDLGEDFEQALYRIDTILITPSALSIVSPDQYPNIKKIIVSGEPSNAGLTKAWGDRVILLNGYGPAETHATHIGINIPGKPITVGRVIPGDTCYILDDRMRPVPIGVPGLIWIGGTGVGRGYRNLPDLTAQKFKLDPFAKDGSKMYNTGDLGRWTNRGELEVIGRADHQVKINGFRVELGEVETILGKLPSVSNVVVLFESRQLVGFISPHTLNVDMLRSEMKKMLPYYMVPSKLIALEVLPMTENRKVDRRMLAAMLRSEATGRDAALPASTPRFVNRSAASVRLSPQETTVAYIWATVLKIPVEGITSETSFLAIGGDSISAILVSARLRRVYGLYISPTVIFDKHVLKELASLPLLSPANQAAKAMMETGPVEGRVELTPIQHWFLEWKPVNPDHYNQTFLLIPNQRLLPETVTQTMNALVAHHDMLRARFTLDREAGTMEQRILNLQDHAPVETMSSTAANRTEMLERVYAIQRTLNLADGPIIAAGLIDMTDGQQRLVITVHHLVMDLVSWRILLEDFQNLYTGVDGLPPKTTSFQTWALKQAEYAQTLDPESWPNTFPTQPPIPSDFAGNPTQKNRASTMHRLTVEVPATTVEKIFSQALPFYQCTVLEILVAALALAYGQQFDRDVFAVDLEGHGREPWDDALDTSRTLGWFTTTFPVCLRARNVAMDQEGHMPFVDTIKKTIRGLPLKGLPYGAMRYLSNKPSAKTFVTTHPTSEIIYNYYGAFSQLEDKASLLRLAGEEYANGEDDYDDCEMNRYRFSIETIQQNGILETRFLYSAADFREETVSAFAAKWLMFLDVFVDVTHVPSSSADISIADSTVVNEAPLRPFELLGMGEAEGRAFLQNFLEDHPIDMDDIKDAMPCVPLQSAIVAATKLDSSQYTWQTVYKIHGSLDSARFESAWREIIHANDMLRTTCGWTADLHGDTNAVQVLLKSDRSEWKNIVCGEEGMEATLKEYLKSDEARGFPSGDPFVRACLLSKPGEPSRLIVTVHHSIIDQWSLNMVVDDLRIRYHGGIPAPYTSFANFTKYMMEEDWSRAKLFWTEYLRGTKRVEFPRSGSFCCSHGLLSAFFSNSIRRSLPNVACRATRHFEANILLELGNFARAKGIAASVLVNAAWSIALSARSGKKDVVFGTVFSGRSAPLDGIERICGPCLNTVPFRATISHGTTIIDFLKGLQRASSDIMEFESTPKSVVSEAVGMDSSKLFNTLVALQNVADWSNRQCTETISLETESTTMISDISLSVEVTISADGLKFVFRYDQKVISQIEIDLLLHHLADVLSYMINFPDRPVESIPLVSAQEHGILQSWAQGRDAPVQGVLLHELVQWRADNHPDTIAAELYRGGKLTYRQLMENANRLGHYLQQMGVRPDMMVPVCMSRSFDMLVGLLAILAAGGAYVPISEKISPERIRDILKATNAAVVVTTEKLSGLFLADSTDSKPKCVLVDEFKTELANYPATPVVTPGLSEDNLAYVLFTSGSTGEPKGVMLEHASVVNSLRAHTLWNVGPHSRVLNVSPYTFDLSVTDIFLPLISGGTVVLASENDIQSDLSQVIREARIDHVELVPSLADTVDPASVPELKTLVTAGEMLTEVLVQRWASRVRLINGYGPTETTIHSHMKVVQPNDSPLHIGASIGDVATYILKDDLSPVPVGVEGEVYIGGTQVCRGYLNGTDLDKEAFVSNPYKKGGRLYRTGDIARFRPDGTLEFVRRRGNQVKVNGLRIDLEAIDNVIAREDVVESAVTQPVKFRGKQLLVAFIVVGQKSSSVRLAVEALEKAIAAKLPSYMTPRHWIPLDALPLNANFKLDRRALQTIFSAVDLVAINTLTRGASTRKHPPASQLEKDLHDMWTLTLGLEPSDIGTNDSFFNLGGDSLALIKFVNNARAKGLSITSSDFFANPTIACLAKFLEKTSPPAPVLTVKQQPNVAAFSMLTLPQLMEISSRDLPALDIKLEDIEDIYPCTPMQRSLVAATITGERASYLSQIVYEFEKTPNIDRFKKAWREVIRSNPILRTLFVVPQTTSSDLQCLQVVMRDDLSSWTEHQITEGEELEKILSQDLEKGVKLGSPFMRFALVRAPSANVKFIWTIHHALYDGWSTNMILDDLEAACRGEALTLRPAYKGFVQYLVQQDREKAAEFWRQQLKDFAGMTFPRSPSSTYQAKSTGNLTCAVNVDLGKHARELGVTISTIFRATWALVLASHANTNDVSFACVSSGRSVPVDDIEYINGPCITCVPVRVVLDKSMTATNFLQVLQKHHLDMMQYEHCSLMDVLNCGPGLSGLSGLFTTMLVIQNQPEAVKDMDASGLKFLRAEMGMDSGLCLELKKTDSGWMVVVDFDEEIITEGELKWIMAHVCHGIKDLVQRPNAALRDIQLSSLEEMEFQRTQWGRQIVEVDADLCIHQLVERQVARTPHKNAVEFLNGPTLTYAELNCRSNLLARHLQEIGVGPEVLVPICVGRCIEMVIAVLGVLKAGGAYVPLDPDIPAKRINFIIEQTKSTLVVTTSNLVSILQATLEANVMAVEHVLSDDPGTPVENFSVPSLSSSNLAYIIYTSGSTGDPKGVMIPHRAIVSASGGFCERYSHGESDRRLNYATFTFDDCVMDFFATLRTGGTICMASREDLTTDLDGVIAEMKVTFLAATPSVLALLDPRRVPTMRAMDIGGEPMMQELVERWGGLVHLGNGYGPTETCCLSHSHRHYSDEKNIHLIGYPYREVAQYLLDDKLKPVPIGCVGEICLAGPQLGRGYLGHPELTSKAWINHPQLGLIYRSGDLGRYWYDGQLIILGRQDDQVKLHGLRIELGEIENVLLRAQEVKYLAAVVMTLAGENDKSLVCFYDLHRYRDENHKCTFLPSNDFVQSVTGGLITLARSALPYYMVPSMWVPMTRLPLNKNGKIDKKKLKQLTVVRSNRETAELENPQSDTEQEIFNIVKKLVGNEHFGVDDVWWTVGLNSLSMIRFVGTLRTSFPSSGLTITDLVPNATIRQLAVYIDKYGGRGGGDTNAEANSQTTTEERSMLADIGHGRFPASFTQERMWLAQQIWNDSTYHIPELMRVRQPLKPDLLIKSMHLVCQQNAILRTTFEFDGDNVMQIVNKKIDYEFKSLDLTAEGDPLAALRKLCAEDNATLFNLSDKPAVRFMIFELGSNDYAVYLNVHHIIADEWTFALLLNELSHTYAILIQQKADVGIGHASLEYVDFTLGQRRHLSEVESQQLDFWGNALKDVVPAKFPSLQSNKIDDKSAANNEELFLDPVVVEAFLAVCKSQNASPYVGWLSLFQILVYRYCQSTDFAILTPVTNRAAIYADVMGCFLNTLAISTRLEPDLPFVNYLRQNMQVVNEHLANMDVPFERVISEVYGKEARLMLSEFQVMFAYVTDNKYVADQQNIFQDAEQLPINTERRGYYDVALSLVEGRGENQVSIRIECNGHLYDSRYIRALAGHFQELLLSITRKPSTAIGSLRMVPKEEENLLIRNEYVCNTCDETETFHGLFERQCIKTPHSIALEHLDGRSVTYAELDAKANSIARFLRSEGVPLETPIVLCLDKCFDAVWWMLGVTKAGCCWVPIEPAAVAEKQDLIIRAAKAPFVVTTTKYSADFRRAGHRAIEVDVEDIVSKMPTSPVEALHVTSGLLAYILFTSGTTGTPKGVMVEHRAAVKFIDLCADELGTTESTRALNFSTYTFDLSILDIFCTLARGGTVCVAPAAEMHGNLAAVVRNLSANALTLTPTVISLLSPEEVPSLKVLCSAGEPITQTIVATWFPYLDRLLNAYGPTETAVTTICRPDPSTFPTIIGGAVGSSLCLVVDERMNLVPIGVSGQLAVGGGHLARGYLNRADLTREKFIDNPFVPRTRMYLTGDRVRLHANGQFEYFGRIDNQVKINGRRTELGEIEHAILEVRCVRNACVVLQTGDNASLIGYVTFKDVSGTVAQITDGSKDQDLEAIRSLLRKKLPPYMVPRKLIPMADFPLSKAGKIDRGKLRSWRFLEQKPAQAQSDRKRESKDYEHELLGLVAQIVNSADIDPDDDLSAVGLDSYGMMRLMLRIRKTYQVELTVSEIQKCSSVGSLCNLISRKRESGHNDKQSALEISLLRTIADLLKYDVIEAEDNLIANGLESYAIMRLISRVRKEFNMDLTISEVSANPSVRSLAALISRKRHPRSDTVSEESATIAQEKQYPASYTQERMWAAQIAHGDNAYHLAKLVVVESLLDCELLVKAMEAACRRHTIMRTTYKLNSDFSELVQVIRRNLPLNFEIVDLAQSADAVEEMKSQCRADNLILFDLSTEAPIRFRVFKLGQATGVYLNIHHIAVDEWGLNLLLDEVTLIYHHLVAGRSRALEHPVSLCFISCEIPTIDLSESQRLPDGGRGTAVWSEEVPLDQAATKRFLELCSNAAVSPFTAYLSLFQTLIARQTGQYDFGVVTPVSLRSNVRESFTSVGCFINTVVVRAQLEEHDSFKDVLKKTRVNINRVLENSDIPFETVMTSKGISPSTLQLMFDFTTSSGPQSEHNIIARGTELDLDSTTTAHFAFTFNVDARGSPKTPTLISIQYDGKFFEAQLVEKMLGDYAKLLDVVTSSPDDRIATLNQCEGEENLILRGPVAPLPYDCIHHGFELAAVSHSQRIAIQHGDRNLKYRELDKKANAVACRLRAFGVQPGIYVAIVVHRSIEMAVALLATLKAGGVCVPISADFPTDRIKYILQTVSTRIVLTTRDAYDIVPSLDATTSCHLIEDLASQNEMDEKPDDLSTGNTIAYCIFTSGTTGTPKGVMVPHKGIVNNILHHPFTCHCKPGVKVAQMLGISFDGALQELYGTWFTGATLVLREEDIFKTLRNVECINLTPTGIMQMEPSEFPNLKVVLAIGEACPDSLVKKWGNHVNFYVDYGATETSVTTSCTPPLKPGIHIGIGKPFANNSYYVLDKKLRHVPVGGKGQIHVGGIGVSLGYINNPELTACKFLRDPFSKTGGRMYATGDMVRRLANGELEFAGRVDDQIKLGGYRVELNEVTSALLRTPDVGLAAAIVHESVLIAFVSPSTVNLDGLKKSIEKFLPPYMIPGKFVAIDEFPRTFNGKADVRRLREELKNQQSSTFDSVMTNTLRDFRQQLLAQIWSTILKVDMDRIRPETSFFELGGNSMSAVRMILAAGQQGIKLTLADVYQKPTLAALAPDSIGAKAATQLLNSGPSRSTPKKISSSVTAIPSSYTTQLEQPHKKPEPNVLTRASPGAKKLRVLCLHGSETSGKILSLQLQALQQKLQDQVQFYFVDGPRKQYTSYISKYFDGPYFRWLPASSYDVGERSAMAAVNHLINKMDAIGGQFDGILGFSEGASIVELVDRLSTQGRIARKWNFSVLISACTVKVSSPGASSWLRRPFEGGYLRLPSVHVISSKDYLFRKSMKVECRYEPELRHVVTHDSGHQIPQTPGFIKQLADRILDAAALAEDLSLAFPTHKIDDEFEFVKRSKAKGGWLRTIRRAIKNSMIS
ncbi:amino acid adenylation domain-containing protein [Spizellomyces punctatus DAOM BR117]|uniref:Amino acid adenylation domain-containing protein n=1 Tax=Spizellomyces punctatus (strain DAOM BR117) TaxID=645134 RepID=A0A0L0HKA2_SPIPD|nr:amino acid adenylation domain-containing protein [Spizellomyces punctatus DAOM BR117]KND01254.1 amino acid adenylation domain-containing protein [Spizellomyces punctatus DAOM BR117]|eukprot:XP_016609293.1 amino acid adenylation domain-containing protein [Spizellomyces punctatus DAOM BR117]